MTDHGSGTLSADFRRLLAVKGGSDMTLGDIVSAVGDRGFGILFVLLSLPSALPVPAPGYSTPFGVVLFLLSLQLLAGRPVPWIPEWASRKVIRRSTADRMIRSTAAFFSSWSGLSGPVSDTHRQDRGEGVLSSPTGHERADDPPHPSHEYPSRHGDLLRGCGMTERDGLASWRLFASEWPQCSSTRGLLAHCNLRPPGMREAKEIIKGWLF